MPVRAAAAVIATVVAVGLLISFRTPDVAVRRPQAALIAPTGGSPAGNPAPTSPPLGSESPTAPAAPPSPSQSATGLKDGHFTGNDVPNDYGDVQVQVSVSGGRIADVQALQLPSDRRRSAEISQAAEPVLHDEVLRAQSAQIDTVSGATFTSASYAQSVQSALDQAHG